MSKIPSLQDLLEAGVHFGHKVSRGNPRMKSFIYGVRDGVHIIDLTLSEKLLKEACDKAFELGKTVWWGKRRSLWWEYTPGV